jgi:transposase
MSALKIRKARSAVVLRKLAKAEPNPRVSRRLLAIANALSEMSRKEAAEAAGMDRQALRDWVIRYNAYGIEGLADQWGEGRPTTLSPEEQAQLIDIIMAGCDPEATGLSAYTLEDLAGICAERFGKQLHSWSVGRMLRRLGMSRQKTRPSHPMKDPAKAKAFKKSPAKPKTNLVYA